jgi:beta-galactosidase/beta-glucuronidase
MLHEYPRPQLQRADWTSLNGAWRFALDPDARWAQPAVVEWNATIEVPFAPETSASGIGDTSFFHACWYERTIDMSALSNGERLLIHFGAVDYHAMVWVNNQFVGEHEGGYTPFSFDITPYVNASGLQTITVRAHDDPHDLAKPRGKQDWLLEPHSIWYPRTTGIWQTVWLERVPATAISELRWTPHLQQWAFDVEARFDGQRRNDLRFRVKLHVGDKLLADDTYMVTGDDISRRIILSDPGIDDYRNELLWSPQFPTLIDATVQLLDGNGAVLDEITSYTALRQVSIEGDRFILNGRPQYLRMVLVQGYWIESGITPPSDEALIKDIKLVKAMGFNGVRKHQKIEDPRFLYWADRLGLLVWEEMPSAYRYTRAAVERLTREWTDALQRDYSHPCIVAWVPFNESWGIPDLPENPEQRHYVQSLYHLTKTLDPSRPVIGNDGWESVATDIIGVHDYTIDPQRLVQRYRADADLGQLLSRERTGGRSFTIQGHPYQGQPVMLTEFGGIAFSDDPDATWGYTRSNDSATFAEQYRALLDAVRSLKVFSGFCYTQFADTYQEANGLLYADRTPKFPIEAMLLATRGPLTPRQQQVLRERRQRMKQFRDEQHIASPHDEL